MKRLVLVLGLAAVLCGCGHPVTVALAVLLSQDSGGGSKHHGSAPLEITTGNLPEGLVGKAYGPVALQVAGGTAPYTWSDIDGDLISSGLVLNSNGTLDGTPTAYGDFDFRVEVTDSSSPQRTGRKWLTVRVVGVRILTTVVDDAAVNEAYTFVFQAEGGTTPYTWTHTGGSLPAGLTLQSDGTLDGTPTESGDFSFEVSVTEQNGAVASRDFTIHVKPLVISTSGLPDGYVGDSYSFTLQGLGGTPANYSWSIPAGSLPAGLTLNTTTGEISGTPTTAEQQTFTVRLEDGTYSDEKEFTLVVWEHVVITTTALPDGVVGAGYDEQLAATGGGGNYSWSITAGSLPASLAFDSATGRISGVPADGDEGTYNLTVRVDDADSGDFDEGPFSLTITRVGITTTGLPDAYERYAYSTQLQAAGGTAPYTWSVTNAPAWLQLDTATGDLAGTPQEGDVGFSVLDFTVTDANGVTDTASFGLNVEPTTWRDDFDDDSKLYQYNQTRVYDGHMELDYQPGGIDQSQTTLDVSFTIGADDWISQTFQPSVSGALTRVTIRRKANWPPFSGRRDLTVEVRNVDAGDRPGSTVLASMTRRLGRAFGNYVWENFDFSAPAELVAGTTYAIVIHTPGAGDFDISGAENNPYSSGVGYMSNNRGSTWAALPNETDLGFETVMATQRYDTGTCTSLEVPEPPNGPPGGNWEAFDYAVQIPANTSVVVQFWYYDGSSWQLVPDAVLSGNESTGITLNDGVGSIDLSALDGATYQKLAVDAALSTSDTAITPRIDWWRFTWEPY